ncbi:hypothetical protein IFM89_016115 [Coptis chinensis]|uniref:Uncharacterized protein n=1 Tax=Coptis chinensis TaxID=261450 RepID=A0A835IPN9_9MAGN|nr:hypothetical protein IFM89_016115 [Coptis chinensis]
MCVDFKAMIEKYYEEDHEESIPLIYEAILRRKLLKKHEDSDNELMEEIMEKPRVRKLPDVKSESESDSADVREILCCGCFPSYTKERNKISWHKNVWNHFVPPTYAGTSCVRTVLSLMLSSRKEA